MSGSDGLTGDGRLRFWGTAASAVQVEGACVADDWYDWERAGRAPRSGDGNGFAERYQEDLPLLSRYRFTDHRISINWARIEPEPGRIDDAAIWYYRDVLATGHDAGLRMWVTLLHSALPLWFAKEGGFAGEPTAVAQRWARWVDLAVERFGDMVDGWMPINNPTSFAQKAYLTGTFPPGHTARAEFERVLDAVHRADAEAALRLRQTGRPVCTNQSLAPIFPADPTPAAAAAAATLDTLVWAPWLRLARTDRYAGAFDHTGFSYYGAVAVTGTGELRPYPVDATPGPLGYVPWPDGLRLVLDRLGTELPGQPLVVSELGYGGDDEDRIAYLTAARAHIDAARSAGSPVVGVFLWTGIDNYEWQHGWSVPFGLFDRDRNPRRSAELLRSWAPSR